MIFSDDSRVSVVVTSCGRLDLLARTLRSFDLYNTAPIHGVLITEDSGDEAVHAAIPEHWRPHTRVFVNRPKLGQHRSIDLAYAQVATPWIFHLEDDWDFYREGFIEDSMALLRDEPLRLQVWLRSWAHDFSQRLPLWYRRGSRRVQDGVYFRELESSRPDWNGFSLNPGLRRLHDYRLVAPFAQYAREGDIGARYAALGFRAVILEADAIIHTGDDAHVQTERNRAAPHATRRRRQRQAALATLALVAAFCAGYFSS